MEYSASTKLKIGIMLKSQTVILLAILVTTVGYAQNSSQPFSSSYEVQKVPANPDVAQLGKFGDIPVNKYNGTANISIPIYEIDFDGLKIPITLRYNTSGVRVEQEASWVGLGWSLSEGMIITREVNGYEDIYNYDHLSAESVGWIYSRDFLYPNQEDSYSSAGDLTEYDLNQLQGGLTGGGNTRPFDIEPDFFTVSLPSGSCKFTLPKIVNEAVVLEGIVSDNKNFKVSYDRVNYAFTVIDPNGFKFEFTIYEMSSGYGSYESNNSYSKKGVVAGIMFPTFHARHMISSWRVSKIESPNGRELNFTYQDGFYFSYPHFSEDYEMLTSNFPGFREPAIHTLPTSPKMFANMTAFNVKNLTLISGDFGSVEFALSDRQDLVSKQDKLALSGFSPTSPWNTYQLYGDALIAKKVDQIIVRNNVSEIVRTADLTYSYFNSQWVGVEPNYQASDPFECDVSYIRLKLDQVDIGDQRYTFEYHQPDALPSKFTRSVDFWGFYNGKSNTTKIPSFNRFYVNHPGASNNMNDEWHEFFIKVNGGNRGADINYGKVGILEKVTYPTGGYSLLDYEGHKVTMSNITYEPTEFVSNGSGRYRFTSLTSSTDYKYNYQYLKLAKTPTYSLYDYNTYYDPCSVGSTIIQPNTNFLVGQTTYCNNQTFNIKINATIYCSVGCGQATPSGRAVWLRNVNTGQEYDIYNHNSETNRVLEISMNIPVGTYRLLTANWTQGSPTVVVLTTASVTVYSTVYVPPPNIPIVGEEFEVGGARLKSISNYNYDDSFISKTLYSYDQYVTEGEEQVSNGKLMDELIFHSKARNLFDYSAIDFMGNSNGAGAILSSDIKNRTNASAAGSHIGYSLVREERLDELNNSLGYSETEFINKPNEYILKPNEYLPKVTLGVIGYNDFHTTIFDLPSLGIQFYPVYYGSVYILGLRPLTYEYLNGSVLKERIYNQSSSLVRETHNTYSDFQALTYGTMFADGVNPYTYYLGNSIIHFQPYIKIQRSQYKLNQINHPIAVTTTEYLNGDELLTTTNYYYDNNAHLLLTRSTTTTSDGSLYTLKNYYPKDLTSTVPLMSDLVAENQVSSPVIMERYKGTLSDPYATLLEKVQTFYSNTNSPTGDILPKEVLTYNLGDVAGQQRVLYEKYASSGTLIQYRKNNEDKPVSLIWSHNLLFPIAQATNAESAQIAFTSFDEPNNTDGGWNISGTIISSNSKAGDKSLNAGGTLTKTGLPNGNYVVGFWAKKISGTSGSVTVNGTATTISDSDWQYFEVTRSGTSVSISNSNAYLDEVRLHPVGSQMTTYTYKPLVGMKSQTDQNGSVTYFEYDLFNRLKLLKDDKGNVLKEYKYNYRQ